MHKPTFGSSYIGPSHKAALWEGPGYGVGLRRLKSVVGSIEHNTSINGRNTGIVTSMWVRLPRYGVHARVLHCGGVRTKC